MALRMDMYGIHTQFPIARQSERKINMPDLIPTKVMKYRCACGVH